jgi:hypothetical protein
MWVEYFLPNSFIIANVISMHKGYIDFSKKVWLRRNGIVISYRSLTDHRVKEPGLLIHQRWKSLLSFIYLKVLLLFSSGKCRSLVRLVIIARICFSLNLNLFFKISKRLRLIISNLKIIYDRQNQNQRKNAII